ncbi:MAG: 4Fe-4S binding protein [Opitutales bacterium]|nr:4Fe-4S binding protein [Opitutales bacterium]
MPKPPINKRQPKGWLSSIALTIPIALLLALLLSNGDAAIFKEADKRFAYLSVLLMDILLFFKMVKTGKTDRYRSILFIVFALALSVTFIARMFETRGAMTYDNTDLLECNVPFCHMVTTMIIVPAVLAQSIIFPGRIEGGFADISSMLVLVAGALLILGRGFCSWGCFYGGWDDAFSRIRKRAIWKNPPNYLRWGGFAVLLLVATSSAALLVPTYCDWVCPYKAVTEFEAVQNMESALKAVVFVSLFLALVVILPIFTKKRTQCAWFCPMGALCSITGKAVSPYQIRINTDSCVKCGKCISACPMSALDSSSLASGKASMGCSLCGKCIDACPTNSISYHVRFSDKLNKPALSRMLFIYAGFTFLAVFSGATIQHFIILMLRTIANISL